MSELRRVCGKSGGVEPLKKGNILRLYQCRAIRSFGGCCWMRMRASNSDINRSKPLVLEGSLARKLAPEWMIRVQSTRSPRRISALNPPGTSIRLC